MRIKRLSSHDAYKPLIIVSLSTGSQPHSFKVPHLFTKYLNRLLNLMDLLYSGTSQIPVVNEELFAHTGCSCFAQLDRAITCLQLRIPDTRFGRNWNSPSKGVGSNWNNPSMGSLTSLLAGQIGIV